MPGREWRTLASGVGAILLMLAFGRGLPAWRAWKNAAVVQAGLQVERAAEAEAATRSLRARIDTVEARQARLAGLAPALLDGGTRPAATSTLASILSGAAARAGVRLSLVEGQRDSVGDGGLFLRVGVRAEARGDAGGISRLLTELEGGAEVLIVREVAITQAEAAGPGPEELHVVLTVDGLAFTGGSLDPAGPAEEQSAAGGSRGARP